MTLHRLEKAPPPALAQALAEFEADFTYPLGAGRTFRISHGDDYPRFFRAIGKACSFVEEVDSRILGVLGVAVRPLLLPDGSERRAAYFGDLKLARQARGGFVLRRLVRAAADWLQPQVDCAYSVVMDGTPVVPSAYTGRVGVPRFQELGKIVVLRLVHHASSPLQLSEITGRNGDLERAEECYRALSQHRFAMLGGTPSERSEMPPIALVHDRAVGRLEDTRRAKRLIADDGTELKSAHLACFACADSIAGAELLREALQRAASHGFPALFTAVPAGDADTLCQRLGDVEVVRAPATVYGTGLASGFDWNVHTSEI